MIKNNKNLKNITEVAQEPIIISASRATDIPAFYSKWFIDRLKEGYIIWKNPFNGKRTYISFSKTRLIVFWSKNPKPLIKYLQIIDNLNINYYFHFTLNYYDKDLEPFVPPLEQRIETFIELSEKIGKQKVIWRFDPYILTSKLNIDELIKRTIYIGEKIHKYTEKLVFSFADIKTYKKVTQKLKKNNINTIEFSTEKMLQLSKKLSEINKNWNLELATCAEKIDLHKYNIKHNKCIDDELIVRLFKEDKKLMDFIGYPIKRQNNHLQSKSPFLYQYAVKKDKGQRKYCGCIPSKDIGEYNSCPYACTYCYANYSRQKAIEKLIKIKKNPNLSGYLSS